MKTGIELIAIERKEQIEKHGFDNQYIKYHPEYYANKELVLVAIEMLSEKPNPDKFPLLWDNYATINNMVSKDYKGRLIVAGALIAAELDRINDFESYDVIFSNFGTSDVVIGKNLTYIEAKKMESETECDSYQSVRIELTKNRQRT